MFQPVDKPITTADAKRIYKQFMKDTGFLDKDELFDHAGYLADEIKNHEECLKLDLEQE